MFSTSVPAAGNLVTKRPSRILLIQALKWLHPATHTTSRVLKQIAPKEIQATKASLYKTTRTKRP